MIVIMFNMINILNNIHRYFFHKVSSITIKQANIFTTLFIFIFTLVFAYLLVTENYNDYRRALLDKDKFHEHVLSPEDEVIETEKN